MDDDHQLSQFLSVTGSSDATIARQYLEMSGNNLEMAVGLFLEHGAGGMAGGGGGGVGSASAAAGAGAAYHHASEVRAPDQTRTMRLMDFDDGPSPAVLAALGGRGGRHALAALGGVGMGGVMGENAMDEDDDLMAMRSTWAALDEQRQRRPASNASSGGGAAGGSGIGSEARRNPRRAAGSASGGGRRRTGSTNNSSNNGDDGDDDDDVQVVNPDGQRMDQDNAEDDNHHHNDDDDDQDSYHYDDESDDDSYHAANGTPRAPTNAHNAPSLSEIFAPPTHLIHRAGGFLGAKAIAKDTRRWLLVNIQNDSDFACHALNRDVWRDELVENLVREGFIFWQVSNTTAEGRTYVERYKVAGYPHLGILDPRTGKLLWRKEGWTQVEAVTAEMFVEMASDFCSRHSFDRMPTLGSGSGRGRPAGYGSGGNTASGSGGSSGSSSHPMDVDARSGKRPIHELSEEEQLQAAIRASMQPDNNNSNGDGDGDNAAGKGMDDSVEIVDMEDHSNNHPRRGEEGKEEEEEEDLKKPSFETDIRVMAVGDEPSPGAGDVARVQIRMPDGKRLVRKFRGEDTVKVIYAFVAVSARMFCMSCILCVRTLRALRKSFRMLSSCVLFHPIELIDFEWMDPLTSKLNLVWLLFLCSSSLLPLLYYIMFNSISQQNNDEAKGGKEFELKAKFPPQDLFPSVNDSISSCGLSGEAINVIWK